MKKRHLATLLLLLLLSTVGFAQQADVAHWQEHKQKVSSKLENKVNDSFYIEQLDDIVGLNSFQKKTLEKAYKSYLKSKVAVYKAKTSRQNDHLQLKAAQQTYKDVEAKTLNASQKKLLEAYYTAKRNDSKRRHQERIAQEDSQKKEEQNFTDSILK